VAINHTIEAQLAEAARQLDRRVETPRLDAELLLSQALGVNRAWLAAHADATCEPSAFQALLARRTAGEPLAYIAGYKDFWTLRLRVTPAVLIPRPETELLVELALLYDAPFARVADLGTGSGAIALAIASERPEWSITATDFFEAALSVARSNASELKLGAVEFLQGHWLEPLAGRQFELIVSNPPYIDASDPALRQPALFREPRAALTPGDDGMASLREIIRNAPAHLTRPGRLLLEHGATQANRVARELVAAGFSHVRSHRDLAGHDRATEAHWI
jgi:release factor glutamine methyltransferase